MKKLLVLFLAFCMLASITLTGCGKQAKQTTASAAPTKETLTVALNAAVAGLFPTVQDAYSYEVMVNIFDTLVTTDADLNVQPMLATSWQWTSNTELIFKLRNDVTFQNGDKMTADDVVYSFNYYNIDPKCAASKPDNLASVTKVDDYTVKFTFSQPNTTVLKRFASPQLPVLDKKYYQGNEANLTFNPMGSGPYKFVSKNADTITLIKNDNYWGQKAKIKNLIFKPITDDNALVIALEKGDADIGTRMTQTAYTQAKNDGKLAYTSAPGNMIYGMLLNPNDPVLKDIRIRQAINYATDNTAIATVAGKGDYVPSDSMMPAIIDKSLGGVKSHTYDVTKAKQLLADAGYANGLKISVYAYQIDLGVKGVTVMQSQLKQVGIDLQINMVEMSTWLSNLINNNFQTLLVAVPSTDSTLDGYLNGKFNTGGVFGYKNADVNNWLTQAKTETDPAKQNELYKQSLQQIANDAIFVPWSDMINFYAYSKNLQGFVYNPYGSGGYNHYNLCSWK